VATEVTPVKRDDLGPLLGPLEGIELSSLLQQAGEAVVYVDSQWVVRYCNEVYLANLGMSHAEVIGRTPFEYQPLFDRSIFYESIENCRRDRKPFAKIGYSTVLGRWLMVRVFPVEDGMMMLANDASESVVHQYHLAAQAVRDTLTGLPNKLALMQDLQALVDVGTPFCLSLLSLNRFKSVNDALGYAGGDRVLMELVSRLQSGTVAGEELYRLNGDEFALLGRCAPAQCKARIRALQALTEQPVAVGSQSFVLGCGAGAVAFPPHGSEAETLLKRAALALHRAKRDGQASVVFFEDGMEAESSLRAALEAELRCAIRERQFVLMLQPQGCLSSGRVVGAEALIRWLHPTRGMMMPGAFLPLAEECGLMGAIDQLVLEQALQHIASMKRDGLEMLVSINLSVDSLADPTLVQRVRDALDAAGVAAKWLEVEVTEGALMKDLSVSAQVLEGLSRMGVRVSVDDFGTGYSSFAYLARFPVQALKIDRAFVKEMTHSDASYKIVKAMVRLGHSMQLSVVAEGAETPEQIAALKRLHCDTVQGYGFAKPMPHDSFVSFALARRGPSATDPFSI
jgi:diguanylate cyclase